MSGRSEITSVVYRLGAALVLLTLAACAAPAGQRAPVIDRSTSPGGSVAPVNTASGIATVPVKRPAPREPDWRPQSYIVQKGDTLYSIAFNFGFDYRELADLNGIHNPALIKVGQEIHLFPSGVVIVAKPAAESQPVVQTMPVENIKTEPSIAKLPYSEQAVAQIEKMQGETVAVAPKVEVQPAVVKPEAKPEVVVSDADADSAIKWGVPAEGRVVAGFSESDNRKGVDIAGKLGQPVLASAGGKVVYSGTGLRGYGKLIIIKHNGTYLSAYAHNDKLLTKEGQSVTKGQKIAEMGNTDTDRVKLHFEIRKLGKPVDPAKYVAFPKS